MTLSDKLRILLLAKILQDVPLEVHQGPDVGGRSPLSTKLDAWQVLVS